MTRHVSVNHGATVLARCYEPWIVDAFVKAWDLRYYHQVECNAFRRLGDRVRADIELDRACFWAEVGDRLLEIMCRTPAGIKAHKGVDEFLENMERMIRD